MITPTVGRVVWFYDNSPDPLAAIVAWVHSDTLVNLMVIDERGFPTPRPHVELVQDNAPDLYWQGRRYCAWMPYQKGQAAKTEALERKLGPM